LLILDGRVHEHVSSVLFFTVFFEGERHDLSKTGGFYECHPEDHAPAPSVRADFIVFDDILLYHILLFCTKLLSIYFVLLCIF